MMVHDLISALGLGPKEHIAVVGGGGKTSLMFSLAEQIRLRQCKVVTTTTTKIWYREAHRSPLIVFAGSDTDLHRKLKDGLQTYGHVFLGQAVLESGKVEGILPGLADHIFQIPEVEYLIVEADGAAGHPVKVPADFEPVIPSSATVVVAIMGLEAIGKPLGPDVVFRIELFKELTGLKSAEEITPAVLERIFQSPDGVFRGIPGTARRIVLLNKLDLVSDTGQSIELAELLMKAESTSIERVLTGSLLKNSYRLFINTEL